jgi:segregation and condensation protein A
MNQESVSAFDPQDGEEIRAPPSQATLQASKVVQHLMFHKSIAEHDEDTSRVTDYIQMVIANEDGEHVSMQDDFQRHIAIAFELVIHEHLDPWDIDLSKFAQLYLQQARDQGIDLVTAGRIILMAWTVLRLQTDGVAERAQKVEEDQDGEFSWDDLPDYGWSDDEWDFTERINQAPRAPIDEKVRHKGDRKVTLMELLGALEEVNVEAQDRIVLNEQKLKARLSLKRKMRGRLGSMMHKEDLEAEIAETWQRILDHPNHPIPFSNLHEPNRMDLVQTFSCLLFLVKSGRVTVTQEEFPRGEIWLTPKLEEAAAIIEQGPVKVEEGAAV